MNIIADLFKDYKDNVIPDGASSIQIQECRKAFYAGAHGLFYAVINLLSDNEDATEEDETVMEAISKELDNFLISITSENN